MKLDRCFVGRLPKCLINAGKFTIVNLNNPKEGVKLGK
jgi:hypothetical protein